MAALRGAADWDGAALRDRLCVPGSLPLSHCSAGQRRRAELLAALAGDPRVLLLDETFAHLDDHGCEVLRGLVEEWRADGCVVLVHHGVPPGAGRLHRRARVSAAAEWSPRTVRSVTS